MFYLIICGEIMVVWAIVPFRVQQSICVSETDVDVECI